MNLFDANNEIKKPIIKEKIIEKKDITKVICNPLNRNFMFV